MYLFFHKNIKQQKLFNIDTKNIINNWALIIIDNQISILKYFFKYIFNIYIQIEKFFKV